ncbi:unnamed protein product, partial [Ectocarpus sp. 12 AP-2014]
CFTPRSSSGIAASFNKPASRRDAVALAFASPPQSPRTSTHILLAAALLASDGVVVSDPWRQGGGDGKTPSPAWSRPWAAGCKPCLVSSSRSPSTKSSSKDTARRASRQLR